MDGPPDAPPTTRRIEADDGVALEPLAARLQAFVHPGVAPLARVQVEGRTLTVVSAPAGEPLSREPPILVVDKVLALGAELVPALEALAAAGLAHGALDAAHVARNDDGHPRLVAPAGLTPDGRLAREVDDVRALASMLGTLAPERATTTREALAALAAEPVPLAALPRRLADIRAAIPLPPHRQIRSIQRLAFPPPKVAPKKSKRHMLRVLLVAAVVGLGLYAAFANTGGTIQWTRPAEPPPANVPATRRSDDGKTLYIRLPPLPPRTTPEAPKTNGTP